MSKELPIRLTHHARQQCKHRGADEQDVCQAIRLGHREDAKRGRFLYRYNVQFNGLWQGRHYAIKQVAAVVAEEPDAYVVITVYTFYF
jgi:hypothetical protein